ncbi:hypothetical protein HYDPIDRAFT_102655, partial [Hydnomerulius pinastri MD-312]
ETVYRVSWLKSKARFERWKEELELVCHEMFWTTLWFRHQELEWEQRYMHAVEQGHQAYAAKKKELWERFRRKAEESFEGKMLAIN